MSPRKVRLVIDSIRGLKALKAETQLTFMNKGAALPVLKLLRSAMANAEHNFHLRKEDLVVKTITADGGPILKRSRPRAFGRAAPIRKRSTHINLILATKDEKVAVVAPAVEPKVNVNAEPKPKTKAASKPKAVTKNK